MPGGTDKSGLRFLGLGTEFAAALVGLTLVGLWIDRTFDAAPWGVLIGLFIGLVGGTYNLIRGVIAATKQGSRDEDREDRP
jgi:F0F1-type ATP synthase assembly protein I